MKTLLLATAAIVFYSTAASAEVTTQTDNTNAQQQQTSAINHNTFEGSQAINNTPGMGSGGGNSTAPCVVASGYGVGLPGVGFSRADGTVDSECVTRTEASILRDIAGMPNGVEKTVVVRHFCNNDESMRDTLVAIGLCVRASQVQPSNVVAAASPAPTSAPLYTFCGIKPNGVFAVQVATASPEAGPACQRDFAANGRVNIGTLN